MNWSFYLAVSLGISAPAWADESLPEQAPPSQGGQEQAQQYAAPTDPGQQGSGYAGDSNQQGLPSEPPSPEVQNAQAGQVMDQSGHGQQEPVAPPPAPTSNEPGYSQDQVPSGQAAPEEQSTY